MITPDPRVLMIEGLIDDELDPAEKAEAESILHNSIEFRLLYDVLKKQKQAIKDAFMSDKLTH